MKWNTFACGGAVAVSALLLIGCTSPNPKKDSDRQTLASSSAASLNGFTNDDPSLKPLLDKAVGYAVFPDVGKAGFIAGASYGKGEVYGHYAGHFRPPGRRADVRRVARIHAAAGAERLQERRIQARGERVGRRDQVRRGGHSGHQQRHYRIRAHQGRTDGRSVDRRPAIPVHPGRPGSYPAVGRLSGCTQALARGDREARPCQSSSP